MRRAGLRPNLLGDLMPVLDIKLLRDLRRLWAQALAISLVIAGGVATLVLAVGSHRSLDQTRAAYYERYGFADVFAVVRRAPKTLVSQIAEIPGVAAVEARIATLALLDIPNFREPASGIARSLWRPGGARPERSDITCVARPRA
jgi:putative ABC transport system permease protein